MPRTARILGTGMYAPARVVGNDYFDDLYQEDVDSFLREHRNILERRWAAEGESTSDLAAAAIHTACERAGVAPEDLDLVIVSTDTPDQLSPSTAAIVQHKLGAKGAGTFDVNTACAGFVTALDIGWKYVASDPSYQRVAVVGAYLMSRYIDFGVRNVASLFADGAGAVILGSEEYVEERPSRGILASALESDGKYADYMGLYVGGTRELPTVKNVESGEHLLQFRKKFPKTFNLDNWTRMANKLSDKIGATPQSPDLYVFTQINVGSIQETMDALGLPMEKTHLVMDRYGYTGSACVPMALDDAARAGRLNEGDLVYLIASGGGAAVAGAALRW